MERFGERQRRVLNIHEQYYADAHSHSPDNQSTEIILHLAEVQRKIHRCQIQRPQECNV